MIIFLTTPAWVCVFLQQTVMLKIMFETKIIPLATSLSFRAKPPARIHLLSLLFTFTDSSISCYLVFTLSLQCTDNMPDLTSQCHFQQTLFRPYWPFPCLSSFGFLRYHFLPSLPTDFWAPSLGCLLPTLRAGCWQGPVLGPFLLSYILLGEHICAQVFPSACPPMTPRGREALCLDRLAEAWSSAPGPVPTCRWVLSGRAKALQAQHDITIDSFGQATLDFSLFISSCLFCWPFALLLIKTIISAKMAVPIFRSSDTTCGYALLSKLWRKQKQPGLHQQLLSGFFSFCHPPLLQPSGFSGIWSRQKAHHLCCRFQVSRSHNNHFHYQSPQGTASLL